MQGTACDPEPGIEPGIDPVGAERPTIDADAEMIPPLLANNDKPCGADTVIQFRTVTDTLMTLCVFEDGGEAVLETGEMGRQQPARLDPRACALDVFLALAPSELPVPPRLQRSCPQGGSPALLESNAQYTEEFRSEGSQYCGTDGANKFQAERCGDVEKRCGSLGGCDLTRCVLSPVTSHQLTCSASVAGKSCSYGEDQIAACSGIVRHQSWRDGNFNGAPTISTDVLPNNWHYIRWAGLQRDIRFRAKGVGSKAVHRYMTAFRD